MSQLLIARFVFNEGDPIDVTFPKERKEEFIRALESKTVYLDPKSDAAFWPNINHLKCFFLMEKQEPPQEESEETEDKE